MPAEKGYYRHPTIHGDQVVFVCEDDLWKVSADGGTASRLTANPGSASFPVFSPDGSRIAFTGRDEGPPEVYSMDAGGGAVRRLTWLGGLTQSLGWSRDGVEVLFSSDWRQPFRGAFHLGSVPDGGGVPRALSLGPARSMSFEPDGPGRVIGRNLGDPARWKRYRGGTAGTIWVDRRGKDDFSPLIRLQGNLANPMWIGARIYFLSDHEGCGNLYSCTPTGRGVRRHTDHEDFYVRFPSTDGRRIVYHAGADLFVFDCASDTEHKLDVQVLSSRSQRNRKFVSASRYLESFHLHPKGDAIAAISRGGVYSMGLWEGAAGRNDPAGGARYRLARWMPDGKRVAAVTDAGGEEGIAVLPTQGRGKPLWIPGDFGRVILFEVAPAGPDRVAMTNHRQEVTLVDLTTRKSRIIARSRFGRIAGLAWSADGRWFAFGYPDTQRTCRIEVCDARRGGKLTTVSRPGFRDYQPAFDPDGKHLYFLSDRVFDPVPDRHYFDHGFPKGTLPMLQPLKADTVSPFSAAARAPRPPGTPGIGEVKHAGGSKQRSADLPPDVEIDFDGIADRVLAFPVPEGIYGRILGAKGRVLFSSYPLEGTLSQNWVDAGEPPAKGKIEAFDFEKGKVELVQDRITDFMLSSDAKVLGIRSGNRIRVVPATHKAGQKTGQEKPGRESGIVDLERFRVSVIPALEWIQMYREAWRLQRDQFWTPDMSGVDWQAVCDRYRPLVDRVGARSEFSDLMWEMQGELGTSHCYEMLGDYRPEPAWHLGFLGADIEYDSSKRTWRIVRIPCGDSWDTKKSSPLRAPGMNVREGDELLEVAGQPVDHEVSPYERLVHFAGQAVTLKVRTRSEKRRAAKTRTITVLTLRDEYGLRYRDWVEKNRALVHAKTKGVVGYLHIPDMGSAGFSEFHRYFSQEVNHKGLIIDVRHNGGGNVSQLILQKLLRKRIGYDATRWGQPESYPFDAPMGPMVALTDEYAGSDGDIFSHSFKLNGLGPLIGKRTWGGVVGIWPRHALVDGTITTQPEFAFWFSDVGWGVENYGTDPDIEVEIRPRDYLVGADPQLDRGIVEVLKIVRKARPTIPKLSERPRLGFRGLPEK